MSNNTTLRDYNNTTLDRDAIRKAIRHDILPCLWANYQKHYWPGELYRRLTTMAVYGYSNKELMSPKIYYRLRLFSAGWTYDEIAAEEGKSVKTIKNSIVNGINWIMANTPDYLLIKIPYLVTDVKKESCPNCGHDLFWDDENDFYYCEMCLNRFDTHLNTTIGTA